MKIYVENMHCQNCVKRIHDMFEKEGIPCEISLEERIVSVELEDRSEAMELLDDLGFDAELRD